LLSVFLPPTPPNLIIRSCPHEDSNAAIPMSLIMALAPTSGAITLSQESSAPLIAGGFQHCNLWRRALAAIPGELDCLDSLSSVRITPIHTFFFEMQSIDLETMICFLSFSSLTNHNHYPQRANLHRSRSGISLHVLFLLYASLYPLFFYWLGSKICCTKIKTHPHFSLQHAEGNVGTIICSSC